MHRHARLVLLIVIVAGATIGNNSAEGANSLPGAPSKVVLEVINIHFTGGERIRSVYLRVYADGTAECHTEKYGDERDIVKKKVLRAEDFAALKSLLDQPEMLSVKDRYELMYHVMDSWMEWNIKIPHARSIQTIAVAGFSPSAAKERNQPYPEVLIELGCSIWKIRGNVFGDEESTHAARTEDCNAAPVTH